MTKKTKKTKIIFLKKTMLVALVLVFAFWGFVSTRAEYSEKDKEKIEDTKDEIKELEKKIQKETYQKEILQKNANQIQDRIYSVQKQINLTQEDIQEAEEIIDRKEKEISDREEKIKKQKEILKALLQNIYQKKRDSIALMVFQKNGFSQISEKFDRLLDIKEKILNLTQNIKEEQKKLAEEKKDYDQIKAIKKDLLEDKKDEKTELIIDKVETQSQINEKQAKIGNLQARLNRLRSILSRFLDSSYSLDDVVNAVKLAEKKTGVRKEFLFAVLDKETDLGRFTGGCYYDKGSNPVKKHMKDIDKDVFLDLMNELGYKKNDKKLSCWPGFGYGGAMGIAQFMPSTWVGYKEKIASLTGNYPPNPWRLEDGVIGMALKLRNAGATSKSKEHYAAKVYYCGGPTSPYWHKQCEAYADTVIEWSKGYDDYF